MATRMLGVMEPFKPDTMTWGTYCERMIEYFVANDIEDDRKKVAIFISLIGSKTYELLKDLCLPEAPSSKSFSELVERLKTHLQPKPTVISERYQFHKRDQKEEETITGYFSSLRRLSEHCEFNDFLEQALRDRLVCGLNSASIRKRLLSEHDLTMGKAFEIARNMETVELESSRMSAKKTSYESNGEVNLNASDNTEENSFDTEKKLHQNESHTQHVLTRARGRGLRGTAFNSQGRQRTRITCYHCGYAKSVVWGPKGQR